MQGTNIALGLQIENHKTIVAQIANELGGFQQAAQYLNKCLYYVYIGTNDYSLNYFQPKLYNTSGTYNPEEYAQVLIDELSIYLHVRARACVFMCVYIYIILVKKKFLISICFTVSINHYIFDE